MKIINPVDIQLLTAGERYVLEQKLKKLLLNQNCYIYIQPTMNNQRPDFILIGETFGIIIIEVKDWSDECIQGVNRSVVTCQTGRYKNPITQISAYSNIVLNKLNSVIDFIDEKGDLTLPLRALVFYVNLSGQEIENYQDLSAPDIMTFSRSQLRTLTLAELIGEPQTALSEKSLLTIRGLLFPEIVIINEDIIPDDEMIEVGDIRALDAEQEEIAKKVPNGHYMVSGIPGSGKTVILLSRALHLVQTFEHYNVLIVTYTKALANKLKHQLSLKAQEMHIAASLLERIEILNFHKLCNDLVGFDMQAKLRHGPESYFTSVWPNEVTRAYKNKNGIYDAVLVDEYQDFQVGWFDACKAICKKNDEGVENLFLAGDRLQRIYKTSWNSYKEIGINIVGRSKLLKTPYRTNQNHFDFALKFLSQDETLAKDIGNFYEMEKLNNHEDSFDDAVIDSIQGGPVSIVRYIEDLLSEPAVSPEDIMILCHKNDECREMLMLLPDKLKPHFVSGKEPEKKKGLITTYHSSKGLESAYCLLYQVESFEKERNKRILLYVGMTRASKKLVINYQRETNFVEEILRLF